MHLHALVVSGRVPVGPLREQLEWVERLLSKAVGEARQFIRGLRPPLLDELGIAGALDQLVADQPPGGPTIEVQIGLELEELGPLVQSVLFRIVQEAVANVRRHSQSDRARVCLSRFEDCIEIEVRDWGVGFDPAALNKRGFGLRGIGEHRSPAARFGAVESALATGTARAGPPARVRFPENFHHE